MVYDEIITKKNIESVLKTRLEVPKLYANSTLDNFEIPNEEIREKIRFCRQAIKSKGLFLSGNNGSGKTHLAIALMKELTPIDLSEIELLNLIELIRKDDIFPHYVKEEIIRIHKLVKKRSHNCLFKHVRDLSLHFNEAALGKSTNSIRELICDFIRHDCICLDDLGAEKASETSINNISFFIEKICTKEKKLIITTNLSIEDINKYDPRMASRIAQMCAIVTFNAPDYRVEKLAKINVF